MLASEIKAVSVHYRPLPLDSRVDFFIFNNSPPPHFWKMHCPWGVYTDKYGTWRLEKWSDLPLVFISGLYHTKSSWKRFNLSFLENKKDFYIDMLLVHGCIRLNNFVGISGYLIFWLLTFLTFDFEALHSRSSMQCQQSTPHYWF